MAQRELIRLIRWLLAVGAVSTVASASASEPADLATDAEKALFFTSKVEPILTKRCLKCHGGGKKIRGDLRVTNREALLKGGNSARPWISTIQRRACSFRRSDSTAWRCPPAARSPTTRSASLSAGSKRASPGRATLPRSRRWRRRPRRNSPPPSGRIARSSVPPCRSFGTSAGFATRSTRSSSPSSKPPSSPPRSRPIGSH